MFRITALVANVIGTSVAQSETLMTSDSEQRDADRISILPDLQGEIMVFEPLQIKNISCGGASIQTAYPLARYSA